MFKDGLIGRRELLKAGGAATLAGLSGGSMIELAVAAEGGAPLNVKIANSAGNLTLTLQAMLADKGYLKQFGLNADIVNVSDGNKITSALLGGDVDVCMISGFSSLLPAIEKGAKLKVLSPAGTRVGQCLYSKNPDVKELKDLVGKTVGVGGLGALLHEITVAMLRKHGIDEKKVTFVNIGSSTDIFRAVVAGTVDAGSAEIDNYPSAGKYGLHVLTDGKAWEEIPEYTWQASYAADETIKTKRDTLVRTLAAFGSLYKFLCGPDSFDTYNNARITALSAAKNDPAEAHFFWDFVQKYRGFSYDLTLTPAQIDYVQDLNVSLGAQKAKLPIDQIADLTIAKDALKLMGGA